MAYFLLSEEKIFMKAKLFIILFFLFQTGSSFSQNLINTVQQNTPKQQVQTPQANLRIQSDNRGNNPNVQQKQTSQIGLYNNINNSETNAPIQINTQAFIANEDRQMAQNNIQVEQTTSALRINNEIGNVLSINTNKSSNYSFSGGSGKSKTFSVNFRKSVNAVRHENLNKSRKTIKNVHRLFHKKLKPYHVCVNFK